MNYRLVTSISQKLTHIEPAILEAAIKIIGEE